MKAEPHVGPASHLARAGCGSSPTWSRRNNHRPCLQPTRRDPEGSTGLTDPGLWQNSPNADAGPQAAEWHVSPPVLGVTSSTHADPRQSVQQKLKTGHT